MKKSRKFVSIILAVLAVIACFTFTANATDSFDPVFPLNDTNPCVSCWGYYSDGRSHRSYGYGANENAIDLAVPSETDVYAIESGTVIFAGWDTTGYGYCVKIEHENGEKSLYGHLSELEVSEKQQVTRGQTIAKSGSTGNSTGPHLHFAYSGDNLFRNVWLAQFYETVSFKPGCRSANAKYNSDKFIVNLIDDCYRYQNGYYVYNGSALISNYVVTTQTTVKEPENAVVDILRSCIGFKASLAVNQKVNAYDAHGNYVGRVYENDLFVVNNILFDSSTGEYTAVISCPWTENGRSYNKTVYIPLNAIVPNCSYTPWIGYATCKVTTYRHTDRKSTTGYIAKDDYVYVVSESGGSTLALYPLAAGAGWKLGWF